MGKLGRRFFLVQCGTKVFQLSDGNFNFTHEMYLENAHEISLHRGKIRKPDLETIDQEKSQMR